MEDFELLLEDRLHTIREVNKKYNLENNAYVAFSGGKDSTVLHHLIDMALPNNKIPRVYMNTGIDYQYIYQFVNKLKDNDDRIIIVNPTQNIKQMLETFGYPFKSKTHSHFLSTYRISGMTDSVKQYAQNWEKDNFYKCPKKLQYQFTEDFKIPVSDRCCLKLKKEPAHKWQIENNKSISITGMRKDEGGARAKGSCIVTQPDGTISKFHPLFIVSDEFVDWFIDKFNIELCKLYYPPYNFKRTGCKGCPFNRRLDEELEMLEKYLPNERKHCELIWKPIYDEYRRIGFRLNVKYKQNKKTRN